MSLEQQISKGIMEAMKAKDTVRLRALRNAKKYIIEAKTAGPEIAELPDADVLKIISKLAKQGTDSAAESGFSLSESPYTGFTSDFLLLHLSHFNTIIPHPAQTGKQ